METLTSPAAGSRLRGIEGLRALAAVSVLVNHVWLVSRTEGAPSLPHFDHWLVENMSGLTLFFALSGFLLYLPFAAAVVRSEDSPSLRNYFQNRALRILPAYWVILLVVALLLGTTTLAGGDPFDTGRLAPWVLLDDLLLLQNYAPSTIDTGILPAWSLVVEIGFYVTMPVLALAAGRLAKDRGAVTRVLAALTPAVVLLVVGLVANVVTVHTFDPAHAQAQEWGSTWHAELDRSFLSSADLFAFGMAAAVLLVLVEMGRVPAPHLLARASGCLALIVAFVGMVWHTRYGLDKHYYTVVIALSCGFLILWAVLPDARGRLRRVLQIRGVVWIGVVSYSIYLWHYPIIAWLREEHLTLAGRGGFLVNVSLVLVVVLALSALTYRYVEAPAMRLKRRSTAPSRAERAEFDAATMEAAP